MVRFRPSLSARNPRSNAPAAIAAMGAYWKAEAAFMSRRNSSITFGMTLPTASLVIANMRNMRQVSARMTSRLLRDPAVGAHRCFTSVAWAVDYGERFGSGIAIDCSISRPRRPQTPAPPMKTRFSSSPTSIDLGGGGLRELEALLAGPLGGPVRGGAPAAVLPPDRRRRCRIRSHRAHAGR